MDSFTQDVLPEFDFSEAEPLSIAERIARSIERARELTAEYPMFGDAPPVAESGASVAELDQLNTELGGSLIPELRQFHSQCRYLCLDDGLNIGGFDHDGVYVAEPLWLSDEHMPGRNVLVFGAYWRYADGDQLLIDLDDSSYPVVVYLHEHGPLFERFAPSFSLALWRMTHETFD